MPLEGSPSGNHFMYYWFANSTENQILYPERKGLDQSEFHEADAGICVMGVLHSAECVKENSFHGQFTVCSKSLPLDHVKDLMTEVCGAKDIYS